MNADYKVNPGTLAYLNDQTTVELKINKAQARNTYFLELSTDKSSSSLNMKILNAAHEILHKETIQINNLLAKPILVGYYNNEAIDDRYQYINLTNYNVLVKSQADFLLNTCLLEIIPSFQEILLKCNQSEMIIRAQ